MSARRQHARTVLEVERKADALARHNCFHAPEDVEVGMDLSPKNLGMDYVDCYLMHFTYAYAITPGYGTQRGTDGKVSPLAVVSFQRDLCLADCRSPALQRVRHHLGSYGELRQSAFPTFRRRN